MNFYGMENGFLDDFLVVKALHVLRYVLRCFDWSFQGCCSLDWEAVFMTMFLHLHAACDRVL
jgi:hypothetical protein